MQIEALALAPRAYNLLKNSGIHAVEDLTQRTEAELSSIYSLGQKSLKEIKGSLHDFGLALKPGEVRIASWPPKSGTQMGRRTEKEDASTWSRLLGQRAVGIPSTDRETPARGVISPDVAVAYGPSLHPNLETS
jgi:hypothetical protein